jgi:hypothetical protein
MPKLLKQGYAAPGSSIHCKKNQLFDSYELSISQKEFFFCFVLFCFACVSGLSIIGCIWFSN